MMAEKPILFSGPMVRAILDGRKTQTRRALKPQPDDVETAHAMLDTARWKPGDTLWVRETFFVASRHAYSLPKTINPNDADEAAYYRADFDRSGSPLWRSSIHMPRWASRITLRVTDARVQRLQDISEADAKAEGIEEIDSDFAEICKNIEDSGYPNDLPKGSALVAFFAHLWDSINGAGSWDANPWVAAITFERIV